MKRWLSHGDIFEFDDLSHEEIKEFQRLLFAEHWDYGLPTIKKKIKNLKSWIFEFAYIKNLFPLIKDEKPGKDYYMQSVFIMLLILVFTLLFFNKMSGEKEELKQVLKFDSFGAEIIFIMLGQMIFILLDRYFYISTTFITVKDKNGEEIKNKYDFKILVQNSQNLLRLLKHWI